MVQTLKKFLLLLTLVTPCYADSLTFFGPGTSYHAFTDPAEHAQYPNKISGGLIWHPQEFGLTYKSNHIQATGFYFKDSLGKKAGGILAGYKYDLCKYSSLGVVGGAYLREHFPGNNVANKIKVGSLDLVFIPAATASVEIPLSKSAGIEVNTLSNVLVTHTTLGIKVKF